MSSRPRLITFFAIVEILAAAVGILVATWLWWFMRFTTIVFAPMRDPIYSQADAAELREFFVLESVIAIFILSSVLAGLGLWRQAGWSRGLSAALSALAMAACLYATLDLSIFADEAFWPLIWPAAAFAILTTVLLSPMARTKSLANIGKGEVQNA